MKSIDKTMEGGEGHYQAGDVLKECSAFCEQYPAGIVQID